MIHEDLTTKKMAAGEAAIDLLRSALKLLDAAGLSMAAIHVAEALDRLNNKRG